MEQPPQLPIWKTPEFWRELAKAWRGPETFATDEGICGQLVCAFQGYGESMEARLFLEKFRPAHAKAFFFPIGDEFRHLRAELCDKIATYLESCQKTTPIHSNPETPTGGTGV